MADRDVQDLATAINLFRQSTNDFAMKRSIDQANEDVATIRASEESEQKKRLALQQLSQNLTMRLAADGTPASTIEQIQGAVAPRRFATGEQAIVEGVLNGQDELVAGGIKAAALSKQDDIAVRKEQQAFQAQQNALNRATQLEVAGIKKSAKGTHALPAAEANKLASMQTSIDQWDKLSAQAAANPSWASLTNKIPGVPTVKGWLNPELAAWQADMKNQYFKIRHDITGVSGSQKEYQEILNAQPNDGDPIEVLLQKMATVKTAIKTGYVNHLGTFQKLKYDVSGLVENNPILASYDPKQNASSKTSQAGAISTEQQDGLKVLPQGTTILGTALVEGVRRTVYKKPDGKTVIR